MPIYTYECHNGHEFEKLIIEPTGNEVIVCPKCKSKKIKKIITGTSFRIKGYSSSNGYSKKYQSGSDIIKNGPEKSIENMKHNMR